MTENPRTSVAPARCFRRIVGLAEDPTLRRATRNSRCPTDVEGEEDRVNGRRDVLIADAYTP